MEQELKVNKGTGSVQTIYLNLEKPVKFNKLEIQFNELNLFVGANGVGKSFVMVCVWVLSTLSQTHIVNPLDLVNAIQTAQYLFDNSFDCKDITGSIGILFTSSAMVQVILDNGIVKDVKLAKFEDINQPVPTIFMSSEMRTFSSISQYLGMRRIYKLGKASVTDREKMYIEMCRVYKLYDVLYIEGLIQKLPIMVKPEIAEALKKFDFKETIIEIGLDEEKADFYTLGSSGKKYACTYSKGEQAILNMLITSNG